MKQNFIDYIIAHSEHIQEIIYFFLALMGATFIKVWKAIKDNIKLTLKWFVAEIFMSGIVVFTAYYIFDKYFELDKVLVYIICTWLGSASTVFHKKVEDLVEHLFEKIKTFISGKLPIIIVFISLLFVVSCGKKPIESTHTIERIIEKRHDSIVNREISKAITDSLFVKISEIKTTNPDCDSITNAEIQKLLRQISSVKKSGNNELGFYYDDLNKKLVAYGKIEQSINEKLEVLKDLQDRLTDKRVETIQVKFVPKWVQVLAYLGVLFIVSFIFWICKKMALW